MIAAKDCHSFASFCANHLGHAVKLCKLHGAQIDNILLGILQTLEFEDDFEENDVISLISDQEYSMH